MALNQEPALGEARREVQVHRRNRNQMRVRLSGTGPACRWITSETSLFGFR